MTFAFVGSAALSSVPTAMAVVMPPADKFECSQGLRRRVPTTTNNTRRW